MSIKKILIPTILIYVLFLGARLLFRLVPNSAAGLKNAQNSIPSATGQRADNLWAYYLINRDNPLSADFTVGLDYVQGEFMLDERCAEYARRMIADAATDGVELTVVSAYRNVQKQQENLDKSEVLLALLAKRSLSA